MMLKPCAMAFLTVYCAACVSDSSGRVAVVATVGPATCIGAVPAGVVPVGTGAHSMVGASITLPSSTPPSLLVGMSAAVSLPVGMSGAVSLPVGVSTPVSCFGWLPVLLQAPIPSARAAATH